MTALSGAQGEAAGRRFWARVLFFAVESWKYFLVSLIALGVDTGLLYLLTKVAHVNYLLAAATGFCVGLAVNYVLSVAWVFRQHHYKRGVELAGFVAIGLVGLGLNEVMMALFVGGLGLPVLKAKIPSAGASFVFNYVCRRVALFSASRASGPRESDD